MSRKRKHIQLEMEPTEKLTSVGDLLVKDLVKKQLSTKTNLLEELKTQKEFQSCTEYIPISNFTSGFSLLDEFTKTSEYIQELEQFKAAGLTENDMVFYKEFSLGKDHIKMKHKNLDSSNIQQRLENIQLMLNKHREQEQTCLKIKSSRHEIESMLSVKPESTATALLKFALDNEKRIIDNTPSAIDQLKNIEKEMMKNVWEKCPDISEIQKRIRRKDRNIKSMKLTIEEPESRIPQSQLVKNSKWDIKEVEIKQNNVDKIYGCEIKSGNLYTIRNGEIVELNSQALSSNEYKKLSLDEIKQIPKFAGYDPGIPSKTLYIKNLPSVEENDFIMLFKAFNLQFESVKILKGRMKGQAFIGMENFELAEKALTSLNGIVLKDKPMIIEFGKGVNERKDKINVKKS